MDKVRLLVWTSALIVTMKIGYDNHVFNSQDSPSRYTSIASHILLQRNSEMFTHHVYVFMNDNNISNGEFDELISIAVDESGLFKMNVEKKLDLKQSKQLLSDVL